jgi:tetratricopeptide (TPR) repeat protein
VARGTQHRKRRPRPNARPATAVAAPAKRRKQKPPQWQEQLFFARLRVHAKWMFVVLAAVFAIGFVVFGVGSGSTGVSSALQNAFNFGGGGGTSVSALEKKVSKHPQNANAWRDLATAYEQKHRTQDAINALERYSALRPKDISGLQDLAVQYQQQAQTYYAQAQAAEAQAQIANPSATFAPPASTKFGQIFNSPTGLKSPITSVTAQAATSAAQSAIQQLSAAAAQEEATYKKIAKLSPNDASTQIQLGQAAQAANDTPTAIAAYRRFLKLAPDDPQAGQVRSILKQLAPAKK